MRLQYAFALDEAPPHEHLDSGPLFRAARFGDARHRLTQPTGLEKADHPRLQRALTATSPRAPPILARQISGAQLPRSVFTGWAVKFGLGAQLLSETHPLSTTPQ